MNFSFSPAFCDAFEGRVRAYHEMFHFIPLKGEHFEEIFYHSLHADDGVKVEWNPNSHSVGVDVTANGDRFSLKTCVLPKKDSAPIEYSSFRTTSYPTINEKVTYLDTDHYDRLVCLTRRKTGEGTTYSLREIDHDFNYRDMEWKEDAVNFTGVLEDWKAVIRKSRSHQLIMFAPQSRARVICEFKI